MGRTPPLGFGTATSAALTRQQPPDKLGLAAASSAAWWGLWSRCWLCWTRGPEGSRALSAKNSAKLVPRKLPWSCAQREKKPNQFVKRHAGWSARSAAIVARHSLRLIWPQRKVAVLFFCGSFSEWCQENFHPQYFHPHSEIACELKQVTSFLISRRAAARSGGQTSSLCQQPSDLGKPVTSSWPDAFPANRLPGRQGPGLAASPTRWRQKVWAAKPWWWRFYTQTLDTHRRFHTQTLLHTGA